MMRFKPLLLTALALTLTAAVADVAHGSPLKTGQRKCWNVVGKKVPCAGTGQDGELRNGTKRGYVDNGVTITDTTTGLVWEKLDNAGGIHDMYTSYSWAGAFTSKIAVLNTPPCFAGKCTWRLPNVNELLSLVDYGRLPAIAPAFNKSCIPGCSIPVCSCTQTTTHWTSTTYVFRDYVWIVDFGIGYDGGGHKDGEQQVRAVRSAP